MGGQVAHWPLGARMQLIIQEAMSTMPWPSEEISLLLLFGEIVRGLARDGGFTPPPVT